ncbi:lipoprotein domain-containing protein [Desulfonema limicola]|uniref:Lipoprotein domain-containing protein n=1 Tax=Desulfonema limicola TaxID=45656 RepID=A0A975B8D3_9BACT|nr:hypothetical protein [Desulfonema limicola]QTA80718.1 lipoprotein domain-containing protein [Desulfonema limicola]
MSKHISALLLILFFLLYNQASAVEKNDLEYNYPLKDPLMATVAGSPPDENLNDIILREKIYGLKIFKDRKLPPTMRYLKKYEFSLAWQGDKSPLIFVIPGTGSNYKAGKMKFLQNIFHDAGFHVICLNSTFTRRFAAMGSKSNIPGISFEDARDIYEVMRLAYEEVKEDIEVTEFYLTGYSLGGLSSAFVADIDENAGIFNFEKVLLINPPVDLYTSTKIFDTYVTKNLKQKADVFFDNMFEKASKYFEYKGDVYIDDEFLYDINRIAPLTQSELEGLIGVAFRMSLANVVFSVDMLTNRGYIKPADKIMKIGDSTTQYYKEVLHWTFEDYLKKVLMPYWQEKNPDDSLDKLVYKISLKALEGYLKQSEKIGVMHNLDDIILGKGDLDFIQKTFGTRAKIYPNGGHLGNMLFEPNIEYMVNFFKN